MQSTGPNGTSSDVPAAANSQASSQASVNSNPQAAVKAGVTAGIGSALASTPASLWSGNQEVYSGISGPMEVNPADFGEAGTPTNNGTSTSGIIPSFITQLNFFLVLCYVV
jgi:hypothetical protein